MDISTSITIAINGTNYTFVSPHDIETLIDQITTEQNNLILWQQRVSLSQTNIDNLNAQIAALCVNPT